MKELFKINLQLFAGNENNPTLNVNATTSAGLSVENKTFYDMALLQEASPNLIHDQFAQKKPIPKNGGKTIEFRKYASLPKLTTPIQEGVTPNGQTLEASKIEATISQYGGYVTLSDILDLTAIDNNVLEATKAIGRQAGLTLDTITRNVLQAGTNVWYAPKVGADGTLTEVDDRSSLDATSKLSVSLVKKVVAWLRANNVPTINGDYVAIIHPYVAYDLMEDPKWEEYHKYTTPENLFKGEIGKIAGVRFIETSEAKIYAGTADECPAGLAVFGCLFFGKDAYGDTEVQGGGLETIVKQLGSAGTSDPLNQRSTVGWKATKTAEILFEPYMMRVECVSGFSPDAEAN